MKPAPPKRASVPNEVRRAKNQEALLEAALKLFVKQGFGGTTVDEIARATTLTKGGVYFYFADKSQILAALIRRANERIYAPIIESMQRSKSPADQLVDYLHWISQKGVSDSNLLLLPILMSIEFKGQRHPIAKEVSRIYDALRSTLVGVVAEGQSRGIFHSAVPATELAAVVLSIADGALLEFLRNGRRIDGKKFVRAIRTTVLHGFFGRESRIAKVAPAVRKARPRGKAGGDEPISGGNTPKRRRTGNTT